MVKFGGTSLPGTVINVTKVLPEIRVNISVPGREYGYRKRKGSPGWIFTVMGVSTSKAAAEATITGWADGTARTLDFEDSSPTHTCEMGEPKLAVDESNVNKLRYTLTFLQVS